MVYNWDPYKAECYDLYVNQGKSITQIAKVLREKYGFNPKTRTFQRKFSQWQFPPTRPDPIWKNEQLVSRVKELWSKNLTATEMLRILTEEDGHDLDARELQNIRSKHGFLLRTDGPAYGLTTTATRIERLKLMKRLKDAKAANGTNGEGRTSQETDEIDSDEESDEEMEDDEFGEIQQPERSSYTVPAEEATPEIPVQDLSPEELAALEMRKQQRMMELQAESIARWATKKRRRRTKPYAGLPADPPCPPRFPSETTLSESKIILGFDEEAYSAMRKAFWTLCEQEGVIKKTIAGPEKWEALKDRLIRESIHLRSSMWDQTDIERKKLAIDVICCDVTKRMRVTGSQLSVAKAKTILNLDPEQGRQIRSALYLILAQEKFTSKHFEGKEHWQEIKDKWYDSSELMRRLGQLERPDCPDPDRHQKVKALNFLARDATRRYREETVKKGRNILEEAAKPSSESGRVRWKRAKPAKEPTGPHDPNLPKRRGRPPNVQNQQTQAAEDGSHTEARLAPIEIVEEVVGPQPVDPLLEAPTRALRWRPPQGLRQQPEFDVQFESNFSAPAPVVVSHAQPIASQPAPATAPAPVYNPPRRQQPIQPAPLQAQTQNPNVLPQQLPAPASMAVFYKLHPGTALPAHMAGPSMWISTVSQHPTVNEVRAAALAKYPGAMCFAIEGIIKDGKGGELPLPVSDDMELDAYLQHVQGNANMTGHSAAPTFVVQLMG